jgi:hypothetical protein
MSIDGTSTALRPPAAAVSTRSSAMEIVRAVAWPAAAALAFAVLVAVTWGTWGDLAHDTGYDFVAAQRIADGQLAYQDFPYIYGPLGLAVLAGAFNYLSISMDTAVAVGLVMATAATALTYALARQLTGPPGAALAATLAGTAALGTGNIGLVIPHSASASMAVVASLAALLGAALYTRSARRGHLALAGVAAGAVLLTRPEFVAAIAVALGAWLGGRILLAEGPARRRALEDAALCAGIAIGVAGAAYAMILSKVSLDSLIHENLFPREQLDAGGDAVLRGSAPMTAGSFVELAGRLVLYGGGAAALLALASFLRRGSRVATAVAVGAVGVALLPLVVRPEFVRSHLDLAYAWIPAGAAVAALALAWRARRSRGAWPAADQIALLCASFLAVLAAKTYAAFEPQPNPEFAQFASYAMPFAAVFLVWLHAELLARGDRTAAAVGLAWVAVLAVAGWALVAHDARDESFTVSGPGGSMTASAAAGPAYQEAIDRIMASSRPGDPILLAPQMSALYTLTGRTDPVSDISLLPGMVATAAEERDAIAAMSGVRIAVTDRRPLTEYGRGAFGTDFNRRIGAWLRRDFRRVTTLRGAMDGAPTLDVWQRSTQ